ncbi:hypothetical protein ACHAXN_005861 [Cyclotella atomus]
MASNDPLSEQQQKINTLLLQCQSLASPRQHTSKITVLSSDTEDTNFSSALDSLYDELMQLTCDAANDDQDDQLSNIRQSVAETLIYNMNRAIGSLDMEIEGPFKDGVRPNDWNHILSSPSTKGSSDVEKCKDPEILIDKCLDLCGYGVSLEVAVECLRKVVSFSNRRSPNASDDSNCDQSEGKPSLSAVVTSLRTIRRRLLETNSASTGHLAGAIFASQLEHGNKQQIRELLAHGNQNNLLEQIVLPLEYYCSKQSTAAREFFLSDSLVTLAITVIPALVSSACHAMQLTLPTWASSRGAHGHLLNSAFRMVLADSILKQHSTATLQHTVHEATSEYFQALLRHIILNRDNTVAIPEISTTPIEPRSILRFHLEKVLASIPAKREVASFIRAMIRFSVSKQKSQLAQLSPSKQSELDTVCQEAILPSLDYFLAPTLSIDVEMREALVNLAILSPPNSFKVTGTEQNLLHVFDRLIPRCVSMLLFSACSSAKPDSRAYLEHLSVVASIWCEEVFVSMTSPLQQQFVTEFLLYPLQQNILTQEGIELGLDDSGASLASMFIQGVSSRLEVSRAESIRRDGMRIAEAVASVFGQTLNFDDLRPREELVENDVVPKQKANKKKAKHTPHKSKPQATVEPNALYFSDESVSSTGCSESDCDASSWGEDSLKSYEKDDDEEDLCRVPRPRSLRDCVAYLLTNDEDREAYDKHEAALQELPSLISSRPLDLMDVVPTLARVLLHMENKFNMDGFIENRWDSLMACAIQAPVDTCFKLVEEMKGHVSLGTRLEALSIIGCTVEELSGVTASEKQRQVIKGNDRRELTQMSTRLRKSLALQEENNNDIVKQKTRRWRQTRPQIASSPNRFNSVSAQMILSLFAFLAQTKADEAIWGGAMGERLLSEYLRTISIMVDCARTYPSTRVLASDLFELAWSFHSAANSEVRRSVLISLATSLSVDPVGQLNNIASLLPFLTDISAKDSDAECREIAQSIVGTIANTYQNPMIT